MKALMRNITIMVATIILSVVPTLAREGAMKGMEPEVHKSQCLLVAKNCPTDSIQERIKRIEGEIAKGNAVYTNDELRRLNRELREAQKTLDYELTNSGSVL